MIHFGFDASWLFKAFASGEQIMMLSFILFRFISLDVNDLSSFLFPADLIVLVIRFVLLYFSKGALICLTHFDLSYLSSSWS